MKKFILLFFPSLVFGASPPPTAFPVFLRPGFSSILEFEEQAVRVVLGDSQNFQVERLDKSIIIKTLANSASTNMFVYFRELQPRLFVLTASDEAEPTYFKRFESLPVITPEIKDRENELKEIAVTPVKSGARIVRSGFDAKKDYLTVSIEIGADSKASIRPTWNKVRLLSSGKEISPHELWAERKEVQKDSRVKARFIFVKPNVPRDLKGVSLSVPVQDGMPPFTLAINGGSNR